MKNTLLPLVLLFGITQSAIGATPLPPPTITSAATPSAIYLNQNAVVTELVNWPARLLVIGNDINQTNLAAQMQLSTWPATLANLQATATATNNILAQTDLLELANWPAKLVVFGEILGDTALPWEFTQGWWPNEIITLQMQVFNESPFFYPHTTVLQAFAPTSFWYTPIPNNAPLNPNQTAYQADFTSQYNTPPYNVGVNVYGGASAVYTVPANQPTVSVQYCHPPGIWADTTIRSQLSAGVPIPSYAVGDEGTDSEMTIYQPSTNTMWEFWEAHKVNGQWSACWGGVLQNANNNEGIFPLYYGATATSLPFLGGQVSAEELQNGVINHAIGIALPFTAIGANNTQIFSWPAHRSDGAGGSIIPEGTRFRIDPTINLDTLGLSPVGKIIAKAGQIYGFVVWDKTGGGGGLAIRFNDDLGYTAGGGVDPYPALFGPYLSYNVLNGIPFDKLQFLPLDYGKP